MLELEEILYRQGVDVAFWGHYHYYDRLLPVYNRTVSLLLSLSHTSIDA